MKFFKKIINKIPVQARFIIVLIFGTLLLSCLVIYHNVTEKKETIKEHKEENV